MKRDIYDMTCLALDRLKLGNHSSDFAVRGTSEETAKILDTMEDIAARKRCFTIASAGISDSEKAADLLAAEIEKQIGSEVLDSVRYLAT